MSIPVFRSCVLNFFGVPRVTALPNQFSSFRLNEHVRDVGKRDRRRHAGSAHAPRTQLRIQPQFDELMLIRSILGEELLEGPTITGADLPEQVLHFRGFRLTLVHQNSSGILTPERGQNGQPDRKKPTWWNTQEAFR